MHVACKPAAAATHLLIAGYHHARPLRLHDRSPLARDASRARPPGLEEDVRKLGVVCRPGEQKQVGASNPGIEAPRNRSSARGRYT
jgi:hypothetical protein